MTAHQLGIGPAITLPYSAIIMNRGMTLKAKLSSVITFGGSQSGNRSTSQSHSGLYT